MKRLITALFCAFAITALPAQATTVTLDLTTNAPAFSDRFVNSGDTVSNGPFSLTFQNIDANGLSLAFVGPTGIDVNGSTGGITSVNLIFNIDTVIESYSLGLQASGGISGGDFFHLSGRNGRSGANSLEVLGTSRFDMGSIPVFLAGETYTLTHNLLSYQRVNWNALGLSTPSVTPVPLPASLPLLLAGFGAVALLRRRHQASQDGTAP
ncbi:MAG: VPLPA-CTERM sorting domain-containing protein [Pseudomonadota bacterium]